MFHDNDSQLVVNLNYQLDKTELAFMITKTLTISCLTMKFRLIWDSLLYNIMHYIIALTTIHFPKVTLNEKTNILAHF